MCAYFPGFMNCDQFIKRRCLFFHMYQNIKLVLFIKKFIRSSHLLRYVRIKLKRHDKRYNMYLIRVLQHSKYECTSIKINLHPVIHTVAGRIIISVYGIVAIVPYKPLQATSISKIKFTQPT